MNYSVIKKYDIANGIGVRVSLFVSGCRNHCKGCFNKETWDFNFGEKYTEEIENEIIEAIDKSFISGLSLLGGEPLEPENRKVLTNLCKKVKSIPNKTIWLYTGYKFENIRDFEIVKYIDVIVDGKFEIDKKDISLKFRGSSNQRIIDVNRSLKFNKTILINTKNNSYCNNKE